MGDESEKRGDATATAAAGAAARRAAAATTAGELVGNRLHQARSSREHGSPSHVLTPSSAVQRPFNVHPFSQVFLGPPLL